jgi:L-arabinose isomerase
MQEFLDDWLRLGGTHHFVVNLGDQVERWRLLAEQLDLDYEEI